MIIFSTYFCYNQGQGCIVDTHHTQMMQLTPSLVRQKSGLKKVLQVRKQTPKLCTAATNTLKQSPESWPHAGYGLNKQPVNFTDICTGVKRLKDFVDETYRVASIPIQLCSLTAYRQSKVQIIHSIVPLCFCLCLYLCLSVCPGVRAHTQTAPSVFSVRQVKEGQLCFLVLLSLASLENGMSHVVLS